MTSNLKNDSSDDAGSAKVFDLARRLRRAQQIARIGYWEISLADHGHFWSEEIFELLDTEKEKHKFKKADFFGHIHPDDLKELKDKLAIARTDSESFQWVTVRIFPGNNRDEFFAEAKFIGAVNSKGEIVRVEGTLQNIHEKVLAESRLLESENGLRKAFQIAQIASFKYQVNSDEIEWSKNGAVIAGLIQKDLPQTWDEYMNIVHPDDVKRINEASDIAMKSGIFDETYRLVVNGNTFWVHDQSEVQKTPEGKAQLVVGIIHDITKQVFNQQQLKERNTQLEISTEMAKLGYWSLDFNSGMYQFSDQFYQVYRTTAERMGGYVISPKQYIEAFIADEDKDQIKEVIGNILATRGKEIPDYLEHKVKFGDGKIGWVGVRSIRILNENGVVTKVFGANQDITERKENQLKLEATLNEKTTLLSEIHHRVKNNLAIISGLLQLQSMLSQDEELQEKMMQSTTRIKSIALVHEILYQSEHLTSVNISDYLRKLIPSLNEMYTKKHHPVKFDLGIEEHELNINQAIPVGLLLNELITNSLKHAFENKTDGSISIKLQTEDNRVHIWYADNGPGLEPDMSFDKPKTLGFTLIRSQLEQLEATFDVEYGKGFSIDLSFMESVKGAHSHVELGKLRFKNG